MPDQPFQNRRGRRPRLPTPKDVRAQIPGFEGVRFTIEEAEESLTAAADRLELPKTLWTGDDFNILAISGGAAGGAFGAGVLVGLTKAGKRPDFAIVTGVSTGAFMAPFAFLGSDWDDRLTEGYVGGRAAQLLSLTSLSPVLTESLFRADALESLIDPFLDLAMLDAVAAEHARGRRLLVATTNLDSQKSCIWDMGEIASRGGKQALQLFRDVLVASASLPGLFPPRRFGCEADGVAYEEMHVDGGVAAQLFVMPEALLRSKELGRRLHHGRIYALVNTVLDPAPKTTTANLPTILMRSFETMLLYSYRQALSTAATFCAAHDLPLSVASIPDDGHNGSMMNFDTPSMRRIFDGAVALAEGEDLWRTPTPEPDTWSSLLDLVGINA